MPLGVRAAPPLLTVAEVAGPDLQVFVRPGALTLTRAGDTDTRVALRPLVSDAPGPVPADLAEWTRLSPGDCTDTPSFRWTRAGQPAVVRAAGTWERPVVEVVLAGTTVAMGTVGRPAHICALHVQDVDAIPGEEVLVLWKTGRSGEASGPNTSGVSILRIPETAQ